MKCNKKLLLVCWLIFLVTMILLLSITCVAIFVSSQCNKLEHINPQFLIKRIEMKDVNYTQMIENAPTKSQVTSEVMEDLGCYTIKYYYRESEESGNTNIFIPDNVIYLNLFYDTSLRSYTWTLVHEIMHNRCFTTNETLAQFETFKYLINKENMFYKWVAIYEVMAMQCYTGYDREYDASYYCIEYMNEHYPQLLNYYILEETI